MTSIRISGFAGFTICELDETKFDNIRDEIYAGCREDFCQDVDIVVRERHLPIPRAGAGPWPGAGRSQAEAGRSPSRCICWSARRGSSTKLTLRCAVLTSGSKAAVLEGVCDVPKKDLESELGAIEDARFRQRGAHQARPAAGALVLPEVVRTELAKAKPRHVAVVHDLEAARLPWECLDLDGWIPALTGGMSRRYVADNLAVGRWAEHRDAPIASCRFC